MTAVTGGPPVLNFTYDAFIFERMTGIKERAEIKTAFLNVKDYIFNICVRGTRIASFFCERKKLVVKTCLCHDILGKGNPKASQVFLRLKYICFSKFPILKTRNCTSNPSSMSGSVICAKLQFLRHCK